MSTSRRLAAVATTLGTVLAGLVSGVAAHPADARVSAPGQTIEIQVKRDRTIVMQDAIRPGVTTFEISSRRDAMLQLIQAAPGYSKRELTRDAFLAFDKGKIPAQRRFEANVTLFGGVQSSRNKPATMSVSLRRGTYWVADIDARRTKPSKLFDLTVTGDPVGGSLSGRTIRATGEHSWGPASPRIPKRGEIRFQNRSEVIHFLEIAKLRKGKTMKDVRQFMELAKQGKQSPPPFGNAGLDSGLLSGGKSMSFEYRLPAGRYVLLCWWPDPDEGGAPHAVLGMYRGIRVG